MRNINRLRAMFKQSTLDAVNNTDEQALDVKDLYGNWEDIPEGTYLKEGLFLNYEEDLYKVRDGHGHNKQSAWNPKDASSEFVKVQIEEEPEWKPYPEVEGYTFGQIVRHNGHRWENIYESGLNVWEPSDAVPTLWRNLGIIQ